MSKIEEDILKTKQAMENATGASPMFMVIGENDSDIESGWWYLPDTSYFPLPEDYFSRIVVNNGGENECRD